MTSSADIDTDFVKTDVGAIPSAWSVVRLGDHVKITSGMSPSVFRFTRTGTPYFKVDQLSRSSKYLASNDTPYHVADSPTVPAGSVVFAKRGAAIALISSGQYIAGVIWPSVFQFSVSRVGWRQSMVMYAGVVACAIVPVSYTHLTLPTT